MTGLIPIFFNNETIIYMFVLQSPKRWLYYLIRRKRFNTAYTDSIPYILCILHIINCFNWFFSFHFSYSGNISLKHLWNRVVLKQYILSQLLTSFHVLKLLNRENIYRYPNSHIFLKLNSFTFNKLFPIDDNYIVLLQ